MILSGGSIAYLAVESVSMGLALLAGYGAWKIARGYEACCFDAKQYRLFALGELSSSIIRFILGVKWVLFFYYAYLLDSFAPQLIGAMCATGVVNALWEGWWLYGWKLLTLLLATLWLVMHQDDRQREDQPYFRLKFLFYFALLGALAVEYLWSVAALWGLEPQRMVSCCSSTFSAGSAGALGEGMMSERSLYAFLGLFGVMGGAYGLGWVRLFGLANLLFLPSALWAIIYFFSPYIYAIPTHTCPFCLIQFEYYGIGYLLYLLLFAGSFLGVASAFRSLYAKEMDPKPLMRISMGLQLLLLMVLWGYVLGYFWINGAWL